MNIEAMIQAIEVTEVTEAAAQVEKMQAEEIAVLGPLNMLALD